MSPKTLGYLMTECSDNAERDILGFYSGVDLDVDMSYRGEREER